jgi:polyferredoxin
MGIALAISAVVMWVVGIFWGGFVAAKLWLWFMVPLGSMPITYWHAAGLSALLAVFLGSRGLSHDDDPAKYGERIRHGLISVALIPLLCFGSGWVAHLNM